jgi:N-acetylglucosamine-6-sulfatase
MRLGSLVLVGVLVFLMNAYPAEIREAATQETSKPNIIFILTDDQDTASLASMATVQSELVQKGTTFENGILTLPVCCPSRATMLRGQYAHNHSIGDGSGENGALAFRRRGLESSTVATWLDDADYRTALVGKYLNGYDYRYVPHGWDRWYANIGDDVWAECLNENGKERCYGGKHPDAVLAEKAEQFVRSSKDSPQPLFLWLSLNAPHAPAPYMRQDRNKFSEVPLPKPPSFDEADVSDKPAWVRSKGRISPEGERSIGALHRDRLRSLQTADRAVGTLIDALADTGRLENTYVVFFTDNGYHMGQHRLRPDKATPYVEDVRFPLVVRGPNVSQGETSQELVLNTDLAPTFAELARAQVPEFVDGRSFAPLLREEPVRWRTAALLENRRSPQLHRPAYAGILTKNTTYVEYENGERELYDLSSDRHQLTNLLFQPTPEAEARAVSLSARLQDLRMCAGQGCQEAEDSP